MHTPAPPLLQTFPAACPHPILRRIRRVAGFSLIEVTLAIAIIAFAFIALIGLLPAGLGVFAQTVDSTNEMRISSHLTSMLMATDFSKLKAGSDYSSNLYYYDVDGGFLDSEQQPNPNYTNARIYVARAMFDSQNIPRSTGKDVYDQQTVAIKALIIVGKNNEAVKTYLSSMSNASSIEKSPPQPHKVRVIPVVISKTDGI
jgi:uncharacterized protein (TIGR02598 family)